MRAEKKRSAGAPIGIFISHTPLHTLRPYEPLYKGGASCVCVLGEGGGRFVCCLTRAESAFRARRGLVVCAHDGRCSTRACGYSVARAHLAFHSLLPTIGRESETSMGT